VLVRADNDAKVVCGAVWGGTRPAERRAADARRAWGAVWPREFLRGERRGGHLGHYTVDPDGPVCICGNHGCVEAFFSDAIEAEGYRAAHSGCVSVLTDFRDEPRRSLAVTC
jgi:hypothetical protein